MGHNLYIILLETFGEIVKASKIRDDYGQEKYKDDEKISKNLLHRDRSAFSKYKKARTKKQSPLPYSDLSKAILDFFNELDNDETIRKAHILDFIHKVGEKVKEYVPHNSMFYFVQLVNENGDTYYNETIGYVKAIQELTYMFYEESYSDKSFVELQGRRDRYRTYNQNDKRYQATIKFLKDEEPLPESIKEYFRNLDGEPAQSIIYNTLIYTMDDSFDEETLIKKTAEIYYYQTLLNYKIDRFCKW